MKNTRIMHSHTEVLTHLHRHTRLNPCDAHAWKCNCKKEKRNNTLSGTISHAPISLCTLQHCTWKSGSHGVCVLEFDIQRTWTRHTCTHRVKESERKRRAERSRKSTRTQHTLCYFWWCGGRGRCIAFASVCMYVLFSFRTNPFDT